MREITQGDIRAAACALVACARDCCSCDGCSCDRWPQLLGRMLEEAHLADRYRKALGRVHPQLGNGTLMAVALGRCHDAPPPRPGDARYLAAVGAVVTGIIDWRARGRHSA